MCFLRAEVGEEDQLVPPVNGWQFWDGSKWFSDPTMECSRDLSEPCREIIVELGGEAKKRWWQRWWWRWRGVAWREGSYLPVEGTIIRGRPVSAF